MSRISFVALTAALLLPLLWSAKDCSGLMLVAGDSYTYSFTSLGPVTIGGGSLNADTWSIQYTGNMFDADGSDLFQVELFGNSSFGDSFLSLQLTIPLGTETHKYLPICLASLVGLTAMELFA